MTTKKTDHSEDKKDLETRVQELERQLETRVQELERQLAHLLAVPHVQYLIQDHHGSQE